MPLVDRRARARRASLHQHRAGAATRARRVARRGRPFTGTFKADGDLSALPGADQQGTWQLVVTEPNDGRDRPGQQLDAADRRGELRAALGGQAHRDAQPRRPRRQRRRSTRRARARPIPAASRATSGTSATAASTTAPATHRDADARASRAAPAPSGPRQRRQRRHRDGSANLIVSHLPIAVIALPCGGQGADLRDARRLGLQRPRRRRDRRATSGTPTATTTSTTTPARSRASTSPRPATTRSSLRVTDGDGASARRRPRST